MSDRLPGSSPHNPIQYRGWNISLCSCGGADVMGKSHTYEYVHDDYDGAPDANDDRAGHAPTVEAAKAEIDDYENDIIEAGKGGMK